MPQPREVVITGLGVVSPVGVGREAFWQALEAGTSGVDWLPETKGLDLPFRYAARIKDFDAKQYVQPRKTIKVMCPEIQSAYAAAAMAVEDGGLAKGAVDPDRMGVVLGSETLYGDLDELVECYRHCAPEGQFHMAKWGEFAFKDLFPLWMLKYLPNMAACHISIAHDARGPNNSIVEGGASSLLAVGEAAAAIERGHADAMLAGGSGSATAFSCMPFRGWEQLATWQGEPAAASRPFDARRTGLVPGAAAGVLLLEAREAAQARGAKILARLASWSSRYEPPVSRVQPGQRAIRQSIEAALALAKMRPADIGHVNAHACSSIAGDRAEAQAIAAALGDVPVTALKSYFGDCAAGSGAVELIGSVLGLVHGRVPRTLNYEEPDPECPVNVVAGSPAPVKQPTAIALNHSVTGQAAAVIIVRD
ncbi:MAG TPA: beta-ketoacyl-[acyl-carrier-protein] synthase family protein [Pirellulaceae bacterium]|nr:beta-ketoacyl-[acyl-carrier-protein] synthase family protein [Pirellulaceae bacterium]